MADEWEKAKKPAISGEELKEELVDTDKMVCRICLSDYKVSSILSLALGVPCRGLFLFRVAIHDFPSLSEYPRDQPIDVLPCPLVKVC